MRKKSPVVVRNFDTMTRLPPAPGLVERRGELMPGQENIWYEYVPQTETADRPVPLVVQLHGGGNDGRRWVDCTIWHKLADQEGFIVVYPNSPDFETWRCDQTDVEYLRRLIELMCQRYPIDRSRIYMQGMSNGEMMTLAFTLRYPEVLAAAGYITGPSPAELIDGEQPTGPLPVLQMRGEDDVFFKLPDPLPEDIYATRYQMNDINRGLWQQANDAWTVPRLRVRGRNNFLWYAGRHAPVVHWEIKDMGHREPPESAQVLWDMLYKGCRREKGRVCCEVTEEMFAPDRECVVLCAGSTRFYRDGQLLSFADDPKACPRLFQPDPDRRAAAFLGEMFETPALYAPAEFYAQAFGMRMMRAQAGDGMTLCLPDGRTVELWANSLLICVDGRYDSLKKPCTMLCGQFLIPVAEFCGQVMEKWVSGMEGVLLIADQRGELGRYTARVLRALLGGVPVA